jgi:pyruvate,water dikinase
MDALTDQEPLLATEVVRRFSELSRADVAFAGGKGANLGELTAAGLHVPPGFVVGAPAYAAFCDGTGLRSRIAARLGTVDVDDPAALGGAAQEVRRWIEEEPLLDWLADAIAGAYLELGEGVADAPVAVRSSATAEDTEAASFAGMNETFLNIRGADAVVDAVRRCWASLFGARTIFYRAKRGFGQADMDIAVVVQQQIDATRAGVMFTIDPATGEPGHLVIEGSFGLGESVVAGSVSPDRYVVDKESLAVLRREIRAKQLAVEALAEGGTATRTLSAEEASRPVLTDEEARSVAAL